MTRISDMFVLPFRRVYHFHPRLATGALLAALALPACAPPATVRAQSLVREHRDAEAVKLLGEHLAKEPDDRAARSLLVRVYASQGDLGQAELQVGELRRRSAPDDPGPLLEMGHAYELAHRFEEALASYDEAAKIAPRSPAGPREGGMRAARWGEVEEARPRLEEAIARGAKDGETWHALGLVCIHLHDLEAAERAYRAGLEAAPEDASNALGLASVAVMRGDAAAALSAYDMVLARSPRYAAAEMGRAWALAKLGRAGEARKALDHAVAMGAPRARTDKMRAWVDGGAR